MMQKKGRGEKGGNRKKGIVKNEREGKGKEGGRRRRREGQSEMTEE